MRNNTKIYVLSNNWVVKSSCQEGIRGFELPLDIGNIHWFVIKIGRNQYQITLAGRLVLVPESLDSLLCKESDYFLFYHISMETISFLMC